MSEGYYGFEFVAMVEQMKRIADALEGLVEYTKSPCIAQEEMMKIVREMVKGKSGEGE